MPTYTAAELKKEIQQALPTTDITHIVAIDDAEADAVKKIILADPELSKLNINILCVKSRGVYPTMDTMMLNDMARTSTGITPGKSSKHLCFASDEAREEIFPKKPPAINYHYEAMKEIPKSPPKPAPASDMLRSYREYGTSKVTGISGSARNKKEALEEKKRYDMPDTTIPRDQKPNKP